MDSFYSCPICSTSSQFKFITDFFEVYQCKNENCGHLFVPNPPPHSGEGKFSKKLYDVYLHRERDDNLVRFLHSTNFFNSHHKILDFGSGPGFFCDAIRRILSKVDITCIETSASFIDHLLSKSYTVYSDLNTIDSNENFDAVIIKEVIEHLHDPVSLLSSIKQNLVDGGKVLITTPIGEIGADASSCHKLGTYKVPSHIQFFTQKSLQLCFQKAGFSTYSYCYIDSFYPNLDQSPDAIDIRTRAAYDNYYQKKIGHFTYFCS